MYKLEIDVGLVPFPLATPSTLHLVSTYNDPKPCGLSLSPCRDLKQSLLLIFLCTFTCREKMLLSHRLWYSALEILLLTVHELLSILYDLSPHVEREGTTMVPRSMSPYVTVFHFKLEFGVDTSMYPWEKIKSSRVWNYKYESQALDASLFAKRMTAVPCSLRVTVEGLSQVNHIQLSILLRDCMGRYT